MPKSPIATVEEVAEFLRTTPAKLANDRYRGIGPKFMKHGRRVLYRWEDVEAYVEANLMQRTDDRPGAA
ncbi:helix-turn-helix domain-containing protein [Rhodococcus pyridinivorans]|uniref:helix-turn-helix domain-containing protein n=1 Tax=Rhodococcus pyridinivorans TaxID=103816 RepID=UPI00200A7916|nr:helix-turn-helix domain-containing protein [Rhodococcus pyridinivorans]UPW02863.1 helix-turn-helix domain-containing protein [Rhodococcus pyridinivorans]